MLSWSTCVHGGPLQLQVLHIVVVILQGVEAQLARVLPKAGKRHLYDDDEHGGVNDDDKIGNGCG
jgi:hypothetical protein